MQDRSVKVGGSVGGVIITGDENQVHQTEGTKTVPERNEENKIRQSGISEKDINEQLVLLEIHRQTLNIYLQQQAKIGTAFVHPSIVSGITEARKAIQDIKSTLRGWDIEVLDMPDDEA